MVPKSPKDKSIEATAVTCLPNTRLKRRKEIKNEKRKDKIIIKQEFSDEPEYLDVEEILTSIDQTRSRLKRHKKIKNEKRKDKIIKQEFSDEPEYLDVEEILTSIDQTRSRLKRHKEIKNEKRKDIIIKQEFSDEPEYLDVEENLSSIDQTKHDKAHIFAQDVSKNEKIIIQETVNPLNYSNNIIKPTFTNSPGLRKSSQKQTVSTYKITPSSCCLPLKCKKDPLVLQPDLLHKKLKLKEDNKCKTPKKNPIRDRYFHNMTEKLRRLDIKNNFFNLMQLLPQYHPSISISKHSILTEATSYIIQLETKAKSLKRILYMYKQQQILLKETLICLQSL